MKARIRHMAIAGLATAALSIPGGARAASAAQPTGLSATTLAGFTSQHWPDFFRFSKAGRKLVIASVVLAERCTLGDELTIEDDFSGVSVGPGGKFAGKWVLPPTKDSNGDTVSGTGSLRASLDRRHAKVTGVWQAQETFVPATGPPDKCTSGPVRVTATA